MIVRGRETEEERKIWRKGERERAGGKEREKDERGKADGFFWRRVNLVLNPTLQGS